MTVPDAEDRLHVDVQGGRLVGLDNGRQESAENYKADSMPAFNGKLLRMAEPDGSPGPVSVKVTGDGLEPNSTTVHVVDGAGETHRSQWTPCTCGRPRARRSGCPARWRSCTATGAPSCGPCRGRASRALRTVGVSACTISTAKVEGMSGTSGQCCRTVKATVIVYKVDHVEPVEVTSPAGFSPALPGEARVRSRPTA